MDRISPDISRGRPGLAALVLAYQQGGDELLVSVAKWLGYKQKVKSGEKPPEVKLQPVTPPGPDPEGNADTPPLPPTRSYLPWPFWRITARKESVGSKNRHPPTWLEDDSQPLPPDRGGNSRTPRPEQLVSMKQLWPMLINDLCHGYVTHQPDVEKIIKRLALGHSLSVKLRKKRTRWAEAIHIIIDTSSHLFPFRADFMHLVEKMNNRIGSRRLKILRFTGFPGGPWQGWYLDDSPGSDVYTPPAGCGRVLILGDLGVLKKEGQPDKDWLTFIENLYCRDLRVFVFSPAAMQSYPAELRKMAAIQPWDARAVFSRHIGAVRREDLLGPEPDNLEELKVLLSCTSLFTPGLLRQLRTRFLPHSSPVLEALIWKETDTFILSGSFASWQKDRLEPFREKFRKKEIQWKEDVLQTIADYFQDFPLDFLAVQQIIAGSLSGRSAEPAKEKLKTILSASWQSTSGQSDMVCSFLRFFLDSQDQVAWSRDDDLLLHTAFVVAYKKDLQKGSLDKLPKGCEPDKLSWGIKDNTPGVVELSQYNKNLMCAFVPHGKKNFFREITCQRYTTWGRPMYRHKNQAWQPLTDSLAVSSHQKSLYLYTGKETLEITSFTKPAWASAIGMDRYGLFADLEIKGIRQRFRWLEPGSFTMGSPEREPERYGNEKLHNVTLSKGFWLADSTVTQEFWQVVMGSNPSRFKGEKKPVESISWNGTQQFIEKLNKLVPELSARLPTEAEWEYGCRAGSKTPFSFGENISPRQVNYNGKHPYNNGKKGKYRKQTVDVKTLPCNSWGLSEMHGNVWEWCHDWFEDDPGRAPVTDPRGPEEGGHRVLRGGSWVGYGRDVRSAIRNWGHPGGRDDGGIGFRLARAQYTLEEV